jgi:8-oxo-dGTP pyrophosphatase MutT (NUDIX family)
MPATSSKSGEKKPRGNANQLQHRKIFAIKYLSRTGGATKVRTMIDTVEFSRQVGALPVRRGPDGSLLVLLVTTLQTQRWIVPKGWPLPGYHDSLAAAAEAREEAGVLGEAQAISIGSFTYQKRKKATGLVPVRVSVFLLEVQEELETWPECRRRRRAWFTLSDAAAAVREPELRELLLQVKQSADALALGSPGSATSEALAFGGSHHPAGMQGSMP